MGGSHIQAKGIVAPAGAAPQPWEVGVSPTSDDAALRAAGR